MGRSYFKNAVLLTGSDVVLRLAGMGLRIYLANALGGEGMGMYQLVLAVYSLFVTLATAGVSVAATRLMTEELSRSPAAARGMLQRLGLAAMGLGLAAMAVQLGTAEPAARWWLGDVRAAGALRGLSPTPLNMALAAGILGWGGISVHFQTLAVLAGSKIKGALHFAGRLISASIGMVLAYALSMLLL